MIRTQQGAPCLCHALVFAAGKGSVFAGAFEGGPRAGAQDIGCIGLCVPVCLCTFDVNPTVSAENAASLWLVPGPAQGCQGTPIRRNLGIWTMRETLPLAQLVPISPSGSFVGTTTPQLLKEVAPASRVAARDSKARVGLRERLATGSPTPANSP